MIKSGNFKTGFLKTEWSSSYIVLAPTTKHVKGHVNFCNIFLSIFESLISIKVNQSHFFRRRRQFCDHVEGYGSVCDCDNPAPIDELSSASSQVLNNQVSIVKSNHRWR